VKTEPEDCAASEAILDVRATRENPENAAYLAQKDNVVNPDLPVGVRWDNVDQRAPADPR
jgi:hypothetical protein